MMQNQEKIIEVIELLEKATTIIYNMEGDLFQETYDKLEAILETFEQNIKTI